MTREFCPFQSHTSFGSGINHAIWESELQGGIHLNDLPVGAVLEVNTANHQYRLENRGDGHVLISGHPEYFPEPLLVYLQGSTWGTPLLKCRFIGRGMRMELLHPQRGAIVTSPVQKIREQAAAVEA